MFADSLRSQTFLENFLSLNSGVNNKLTCITHGNNNLYAAGDNLILASYDLGNTWNQNYFDSLSGEFFKKLAANGLKIITLTEKQAFRSSDGGNSWSKIIIPGSPSVLGGVNFTDKDLVYLTAIRPASPGHLFSSLYRSKDAGISWEITKNFEDFEAWDVIFINELVGYVIGDYREYGSINPTRVVLLTTTDGGLSWSQEDIEPLTMNHALKLIVSDEKIHILGQDLNQTVSWARRADTGWQTLNLTWTVGPDQDFFASNNKAYLVGKNGLITRMDSIRDWGQYYPTTISPITNSGLCGVDIAADGIYIVGDSGTILKSDFPTNIEKKINTQSLLVYPNPCPGRTINIRSPEKFSYRLLDSKSKEISHWPLGLYQSLSWPLNLNTGIYFLEITDQQGQKIFQKIIH